MIKKRLLILAEHLEKIAKRCPKNRRFNMGLWFVEEHDARGHRCGTSGCAIGEAVLIPEFKALGLKISENQEPVYKGDFSWMAVERFFGLTSHEATCLFSYEGYISRHDTTPDEVAAAIREFVKG